jgi:hypothetical protein
MANDFYISINTPEMARLHQLTSEALALYLCLKEKANFQTGIVGTFFNQKLTFAAFARMLCRPASQGREAKTFDSTDVKRLLAQLEGAGLVQDQQWDGARLTLHLPLSPKWKNNPELDPDKGKLPWGSNGKPLPTQSQQGLRDVVQSPSVMTSKRGSIPFFNTGITTDHGGVSAADLLEERGAQSAAKAPTKCATASGNLVEAFHQRLSAVGVFDAQSPDCRAACTRWVTAGADMADLDRAIAQTMLFDATPFESRELNSLMPQAKPKSRVAKPAKGHKPHPFESCLAEAGGVLAETKASHEYYVAWEKAGISVTDIERAISARAMQQPGPFRAGDLNPWLFPSQKSAVVTSIQQMRGRVAL